MALEPKPISQESESGDFTIGGDHNDSNSGVSKATDTMRVSGLTSMFAGVADPESHNDSSPESKKRKENETLDRIMIAQSLKNSIAATRQVLVELEQEKADVTAKIDALNIQIDEVDAQLIVVDKDIAQDREAIENTEARAIETTQKAESLSQAIQETQALVEQDDIAMALEEEQKALAEQEAAQLAEDRGFWGQLAHDAGVATGLAAEDECVQKRIICEGNICRIAEDKEQHTQSLKSLQAEVDTVKNELSDLQAERAELQAKLDEDLGKKSELTSLRSGLIDERTEQQKRLTKLDTKIEQTQSKLESLEKQLEQYNTSDQDAELPEPEPNGFNPALDNAMNKIKELAANNQLTTEALAEFKEKLSPDVLRHVETQMAIQEIEPHDRPHVFGGEGHRQDIAGLSPDAARAEHVSISAQHNAERSQLTSNFGAQAIGTKPPEPTVSLAKDMTSDPTVEFTGALSA